MPTTRRPLSRRAATGAVAASVAAIAIAGIAVSGAAASGGRDAAPDEGTLRADARELFDEWNGTLATGDPAAVDAMYAPDAVLLPTVSPGVHDTSADRLRYFEGFLANDPSGAITEDHVRSLGPDSISHSGLYTFTMGETGDVVAARFTFDWTRVDGEWRIVEHHSSKEPVAQ
ncbi:DUF4440 domain-containing protein [Clavibacter michiganensis]|uniref:DUF4440 domain-containing protein n=1 Tax=Clavibacter michiganensis TaxID=28447 RepID=A0A2S5VUM4_9MICO|nr:SgcJ/EcaC family oxidoreductase [Clavibacter michiganensis]PPF68511.1 DUF4440 domain-containing protein [Clavibacter michiganensis]